MRWFLGALALLFVAVTFRLGLLACSMYALLATIALSRYLANRWSGGLDARREMNTTKAAVGAKVAVVVTISNRARLPVPWMLLEDLLPRRALIHSPSPLEVAGERLQLVSFRSGGKKTILYQMKCNRRGYYQVGPLIAETGDVFGLYRRYRVLSDPSFLTVLPEVVPLTGFDIASRRPIGEVRMSYQLFEDPTRIRGVREYQPGDPFNRIHWRATARAGSLQSKVYEPSTVAGVSLLLDFHKESFVPADEPVRSELAITAAASILGAVCEMGQQAGLCTNGRDAADWVRTGRRSGWRVHSRTEAKEAGMSDRSDRLRPLIAPTERSDAQLGRLLELLARVEKTDGLAFPDLVRESAARLPRSATVVVLLSIVTPQHAIALNNLQKQGFVVTTIVNVYDDPTYQEFAGLLAAEGIEVRQLKDRDAIPRLCSNCLVH